MHTNEIKTTTIVIVAIAILCFPSISQTQRTSPAGEVVASDRNVSFTTDYPRPLESVTYTLRYKYGVLVTFEEAPLEYSSDSVDPQKGSTNEGRTLLPRGGRLQFSFELSEDLSSPSDPKSTIETAIDAYHREGYPGRYSLQKSGAYFHIIPVARKNTQGVMESVGSPLDTIVTITGEPKHPHLVLRQLATQVGKTSGYPVYIAHSPFLRGNEVQMSCDFVEVPARSVLLQLLERTGKRSAWLMMFDINNRSYYLSIQ